MEQVPYSHRISESDITVSPAAKAKLAELLADEDAGAAVRVFVAGGGCGGMTYGMTYAEDINEYDSVLEEGAVRLVADPIALNYLQGALIDYRGEGAAASFVFQNVFRSVGGSGTCGGCGAAGGGRF